MKWCGYEYIYFLTNLLQAKTIFLCQFGKVITRINNDWKVKLDSQRTVYSKQLLNQFLNQVVLIAIFNNWKSLAESWYNCARKVLLHSSCDGCWHFDSKLMGAAPAITDPFRSLYTAFLSNEFLPHYRGGKTRSPLRKQWSNKN